MEESARVHDKQSWSSSDIIFPLFVTPFSIKSGELQAGFHTLLG